MKKKISELSKEVLTKLIEDASSINEILKQLDDTEDNSNNSFYGEIVASGQPFYYGKRNSKEAEYVFKGRKADVIKEGGKPIKKEIVNNFLFINGDNDKARELEDWKFWKNKLNEGIPVFFLLD